jgi:hypothetical protein
MSISKGRGVKYHPVIRTIYVTYKNMMYRCHNPKFPSYKWYGKFGISVCEEWRDSYQAFLDWSLANGWKEEYELDKDILGDGMLYSPETCKWVSHKENMLHMKQAKNIIYNGKKLTISGVSDLVGIAKSALRDRMLRGYSIDEAILMGQPVGKSANTRYITHNGETLSLRAMCKKHNLRYSLIKFRINQKGISFEEAIKTKSSMPSKYDNLCA